MYVGVPRVLWPQQQASGAKAFGVGRRSRKAAQLYASIQQPKPSQSYNQLVLLSLVSSEPPEVALGPCGLPPTTGRV